VDGKSTFNGHTEESGVGHYERRYNLKGAEEDAVIVGVDESETSHIPRVVASDAWDLEEAPLERDGRLKEGIVRGRKVDEGEEGQPNWGGAASLLCRQQQQQHGLTLLSYLALSRVVHEGAVLHIHKSRQYTVNAYAACECCKPIPSRYRVLGL
jgi:hypothetical protein